MMASTTFTIPAALAEALGHMQRPIACPEEVKVRIAALRVPLEEVNGTRMPTNWRTGPSGGSSGGGHATGGRGWGNGGGGGGRGNHGNHGNHGRPHGGGSGGGGGGHGHGHSNGGGGGWRPASHQQGGPRRPFPDRALMPRFGNKARKDAATEDRMLDLIRKKMNLFTEVTYDATKSWLSELLDSGETAFLTGFITLVFEKAAREPELTELYARLLTELRAGFPHVGVELNRIFGDFLNIFEEAAHEPDVGSEEYATFIKLRTHRQFRRGYASFIGDVAKQGALSAAEVTRTSVVILDGLFAARAAEGKSPLCEEYADCLRALLVACPDLMRPAFRDVHGREQLARVRDAQKKDGAPSMTSRARFALMDITDLYDA